VGCVYTDEDGKACDDGDPCATGDFCDGGLCQAGDGPKAPGCPDGNAICALSGTAGSAVDCDFLLAANTAASNKAAGLQAALNWDATKASFLNFYTETCFPAAGCFEVALAGPGSMPLSTGHSLSVGPLDLAEWSAQACGTAADCGGEPCTGGLCEGSGGFGAIVVVNLSNPYAPITDAYLDAGGAVVGEPKFMWARFELLADVATEDAATVEVSKPLASSTEIETLSIVVLDGVMVTKP
jgi:hypothetical protein